MVPPVPALEKDSNHHRGLAVTANGSPVLIMENASILPSLPGGTPPTSNGRAPHARSHASNSGADTPLNSVAGDDEISGLKDLTGSLTRRAHRESDMQRRQRLLMFAKVSEPTVLNSLLHADLLPGA